MANLRILHYNFRWNFSRGHGLHVATMITTVIATVTMCKRWLIVVLLIFFCATANVNSNHFRGGVIMVRPRPGGEAKEVIYIIVRFK